MAVRTNPDPQAPSPDPEVQDRAVPIDEQTRVKHRVAIVQGLARVVGRGRLGK